MSAALDAVEAWVCAYNEAANIGPCIEAIRAGGIAAEKRCDLAILQSG